MKIFDTITIQEISKEDMFLIIHALEYTGKETDIDDFLELKDNLIEELSALAGIPKDDFIGVLEKETQSS